MVLPDPTYMDLVPWTEAMAYALTQYPDAGPMTGGDWRAWGMYFFNTPSLAVFGPPDPHDFDDWRLWAERLYDALGPASGTPQSPSTMSAGPFGISNFIITQTSIFITTQSGNNLITQ